MARKVSVKRHQRRKPSGGKTNVRKHTRVLSFLSHPSPYSEEASKMISTSDLPLWHSNWRAPWGGLKGSSLMWDHTDPSRKEYIVAEQIEKPPDMVIFKGKHIWKIKHIFQNDTITEQYTQNKEEALKMVTRMKRASPYLKSGESSRNYLRIMDALWKHSL